MGCNWKARRASWWASLLALSAAAAAPAQTGSQTEKQQQASQAERQAESPVPAFAVLGPSREIKLAENTWFRFGAQVQAWYKIQQDRLPLPGSGAVGAGSDGTYAMDYYCRRCRLFTTGSVVKNVFFNVLFEATNLGKADPVTGVKTAPTPVVLDAYAQVKFIDEFWLSGGSILLPLTRNGTQPTTTYLSIDVANVTSTPVLQGNTNVLRDLGFQANGFFLANHLEYRIGVFQGSRQASTPTQTASHNGPRFVSYLNFNFWDTETGYVNGGHYFGARKVLGVMGNFDYQILRKDAPGFPAFGSPPGTPNPAAGADKNAYFGVSGAVYINYPLNGPHPRGGDELVGLLQFGYYDGGLRTTPTGTVTNQGSYPNVLKQFNYLAEAAYYNHGSRFSIFGKFEGRKVSDDYPGPFVAASNQYWLAGGVKYYVAPFNLLNFALQYERNQFTDTDKATVQPQQSGTNSLTFQMQLLLY
jgi:hypothetical protein